MGIDRSWRRKLIKRLGRYRPEEILDIATGTGDLAIAALKVKPGKITGIDLSEGMLEKARNKTKSLKNASVFEFMQGDSEDLPFSDNQFDAAMVAFGVRNFENLSQGLREINRVIKPGSPLLVLEFSMPENFFIKWIYRFYFRRILPFIGAKVSKDASAYAYLPESVSHFPQRNDFLKIMNQTGFERTELQSLSFGIAHIYCGEKSGKV